MEQIFDNFVVTHELIHYKGKKNRRKRLFTFKVEMSKAYDRVEWSFLIQILQKIGLPSKFIDLMCARVCTSTIEICSNGEAKAFFQGCPLSITVYSMLRTTLFSRMQKAERNTRE